MASETSQPGDRKLRDWLGTYVAGALICIVGYWVKSVDGRRAEDRSDWQLAIRDIIIEQKRFNDVVLQNVPRHASHEARLNALDAWRINTDSAIAAIHTQVNDRLETIQTGLATLGREVSALRASLDAMIDRTNGKSP